jgi:peptide/nickel transport system substrate-binding protein
MNSTRLISVLAAAAALVTACSPVGSGSRSSEPVSGAPAAPKVLTIGLQREMSAFGHFVTNPGGSATDGIVHDGLVATDYQLAISPQLAAEIPSVEKGTWKLNTDGSMDTTWKLRPNIKWQDGTPFTSEDLAFTYQVFRDKDLPSTQSSAMVQMESVTTPDPQTFVIHWAKTDTRADQPPGLFPIAKHLLGDIYRTDKASLPTHAYFTTDFVGLGPYRLARWDAGVQQELVRFDDYYMGRPPLDRVILKYVRDPSALVANILAGSVDAIGAVDLEAATEVKRRWEGTQNQVTPQQQSEFARLEIQFRPEFSSPKNGLATNRDVREALYRAVDKPAMAEVMTQGLSPVADSWFPPNHPLRPERVPQFPLDLNRAQQLLNQAGWQRGSDGILVDRNTGERFEVEIWGQARAVDERVQAILADQWKALGVQASVQTIPTARADDREFEATRPGGRVGNLSLRRFLWDNYLSSKEAATAANRWGGRNKLAYSNSQVDALQDKLTIAIDAREQKALHQQIVEIAMNDIATMPFYWQISPMLTLAGVKNVFASGDSVSTHNVFQWDK